MVSVFVDITVLVVLVTLLFLLISDVSSSSGGSVPRSYERMIFLQEFISISLCTLNRKL